MVGETERASFKLAGEVLCVAVSRDGNYAAAGSRHFEKAVPADWVVINKDATVGAEVDKPWVSKDDGVRFGFILTRIGLTK